MSNGSSFFSVHKFKGRYLFADLWVQWSINFS